MADPDLDEPHGRLEWARARAYSDAKRFADAVGVHPTTYRAYENGQNGFTKHAARFATKLGVPVHWLLEGGATPDGSPAPAVDQTTSQPVDDSDPIMVGIQNMDLAYGLGKSFADEAVQVEVLQFPKVWVNSITWTDPELLTWARARGDSMGPTIDDGDLVLLDRSQRKITEQDALWAYADGETYSIKRLRVKRDRVTILSDNPTVPPDEEMLDHIHIVARVIFVGKRK